MVEEMFNLLTKFEIFSKEKETIKNFLEFNKKILKQLNKEYCYASYSAQLMTNWILLSFNSNFMDRSYIDKNTIYTNNYDFINKFCFLFKMYLKFFDNNYNISIEENKNIRHVAFYVINIFINKNIIKKFNIDLTTKNYKKKNPQTKTHSFLYLEENNFENNNINFNLFLKKPKIYIINKTYYLGGIHYYSYNKLFKKNYRSNEHFKLKNKEIINKICSLQYKIDFSFYIKIKNLICKHLDLKNNNTDLNDFIKNHLKKIYNKNIFNAYANKKTEEEIENEKKIFQQEYNKILTYYLFIQIEKKLKDIKEFYLAVDFDFRGRLYPKSCISPTGNKIFRFLYYYGYYSENELKNITLREWENSKINIIKKCILFKLYDKINFDDNVHLTYCYWCLFEIGKIFKNELSFKKNGVFNDEDLISFSCEIIEKIIKNEIKLSFDDELQYIYIISCLEDLNKGLYKKLIIYKDATASGIQLLTTVLGANNEETLKNCNLRSYSSWYDTYTYIINLFVEKYMYKLEKLDIENYKEYVKRSYLKKSIMTYVYGAGEKTALFYYLEGLPNKVDKKIAKKIFIMFYEFLDILFSSTNFFGTSSTNMIEDAKKEYEKNKKIYLKTTDKASIPLVYYKIIFYRLDRIIEENRNTILFTNKSDLFDKNKTYGSILANITHSLDALFLRLIILEMDKYFITIHDSFGIDILNIDKLIKAANIAINKIFFSFNDSGVDENKLKINQYYSSYILM